MVRSHRPLRVLVILGIVTVCFTLVMCASAQTPPGELKSIQGDWDSLKPVIEDDGIELRASDAKLAEVTRRAAYFKSTAENIRKQYVQHGFVVMPKWRVGIIDDSVGAARGETVSADLTFFNGGLLSEPELELTSTMTHEAFHIVQNNSFKAMESTNEEFTKWEDESTASWMQYKFCPDSALVRTRSIDMAADDFQSTYFSWEPVNHPYSCFNFWCYLDELYGAEDLIHLIYINPGDAKAKLEKAENFCVAMDRILKTRKDRKGRIRQMPDLFVEYLIRYAFKKDAEPFAQILASDGADGRKDLLVQHVGKPGELLVGSCGRDNAEIPYMEGKDRKQKKTFAAVDSPRYGIAKQYDIKSTAKGDDEKGMMLQVSVAGPAGKARLLVFPYANNGLMDPLIGKIDKPVQVEKWETLGGAIVVLVDVGQDQLHKFAVTAEMKSTPRWNIAATDQPVGFVSVFNLKSIRLTPKLQPSDEDAKKLEGKWFLVTIVLDEKILYTYGRFHNSTGYIWPPHVPVKQGDHTWHITTIIGDEQVVLDGATAIEIAGENLEIGKTVRGGFESTLKMELQHTTDPQEKDPAMWKQHAAKTQAAIAQLLYSQGNFKESMDYVDAALEKSPDLPEATKLAADLCLANGEIERYVEYCEKWDRAGKDYRESLHYRYAAEAFVLYRNDLRTAWKYQTMDDEKMKSFNQKPQRPMYPKLEDESLDANWQKR